MVEPGWLLEPAISLEPAMNAIYTGPFLPRAELLAKGNHSQPWLKTRPDFSIDFLLTLATGYLADILTPDKDNQGLSHPS